MVCLLMLGLGDTAAAVRESCTGDAGSQGKVKTVGSVLLLMEAIIVGTKQNKLGRPPVVAQLPQLSFV